MNIFHKYIKRYHIFPSLAELILAMTILLLFVLAFDLLYLVWNVFGSMEKGFLYVTWIILGFGCVCVPVYYGNTFLEIIDRKKNLVALEEGKLFDLIIADKLSPELTPHLVWHCYPEEMDINKYVIRYIVGDEQEKFVRIIMSKEKYDRLNTLLFFEKGTDYRGRGKYTVNLEFYKLSQILLAIHPAEGESYPEGFAEQLQELNKMF